MWLSSLQRKAFFLLFAIASAIFFGAPAEGQERTPKFALVVGESDYEARAGASFTNLEHPAGDARAIGAQLRTLGFEVIVLQNADADAIVTAFQTLASRASFEGPESVFLFYYGGHAVVRDGVDTLAPIGASETTGRGFISVPELLRRLPPATGADLNIVVINACRTTTNETEIVRSLYPPRGTIMAYATEPGTTATDGQPGTPHSPYAAALLERLRLGGTVLQVLNGAARDTEDATRNWTTPQRPQLLHSPVSEMCFSNCLTPRGTGGASGVPFIPDSCLECPQMMALRGDVFLMGSPATEPGRNQSEGAQRWVTIQDFAVSTHEVTVAEYSRCVRARACRRNPHISQWGDGNHPVVNVTWGDAVIFAGWLAEQSGLPYRLLSEAEWEYAARAGTHTRYSNGGDEDRLCEIANHADASSSFAVRNMACSDNVPEGTAPVGSFAPNPWGLYDMHGNVWEWVQDCFSSEYAGAPVLGEALDVPNCPARVDRGGGWMSGPVGLRSADRGRYAEGESYGDVGFRVGYSMR